MFRVQLPKHAYKKATQELVRIPNHLDQAFTGEPPE